MPDCVALRSAVKRTPTLDQRFVEDARERLPLADLVTGSALYGRGEELAGRSVLLATNGQLTTVVALLELDGVARRVVVCPPDLPLEHLSYVIDLAEVDGIISDRAIPNVGRRPLYFSPCSTHLCQEDHNFAAERETEWVLLTSGTTGRPKLVAHTLASLRSAIDTTGTAREDVVWSTFYDVRRYGGMQILLRALLTGTSLVLTEPPESVPEFLARAAERGVTHISGTPSHWRRALMSPAAKLLRPAYVRISGEAVDQSLLHLLRAVYPSAKIVHAFASTEAGVAFEVHDGLAGFPAAVVEGQGRVELKVEAQTLRIRSNGVASRYLGDNAPVLRGGDGFVDTGDIVELRDGRYQFAGRRDGVINVGGLKVYPEEIEAVIQRHPQVEMCVVRAKKSAITGYLVVADVVLKNAPGADESEERAVQEDILQMCRETLAAHKVPAAIHIVPMPVLSGAGKVLRQHA